MELLHREIPVVITGYGFAVSVCVNIQFFMENKKMKRKRDKKMTFPNGDLNPGYLNKFPPTIGILREIRSIELTVFKKSRL